MRTLSGCVPRKLAWIAVAAVLLVTSLGFGRGVAKGRLAAAGAKMGGAASGFGGPAAMAATDTAGEFIGVSSSQKLFIIILWFNEILISSSYICK